jgi:iron complex transport system substrate-binding protein
MIGRLRRYPDSRIVVVARAFPSNRGTVAFGRLPAYSGATVPASHRLPARKRRLGNCAKVGAFPLSYSQEVHPILTLAIAWCATLLCACAPHPSAENSASAPPHTAGRVVTLVPSFADDIYAIGAGSQLVGVSAFSDAPQAKALPRVADASSVDVEAILALRPSVVIGIPAQARLVEPLARARVRVVLLSDDAYERIFANLRTIGALTGRRGAAAATIARLQHETAELQARTKSYARRPSVFVVLGSGPIWTAGSESYITKLIALAGGINAASDLHAAYGEYSAEALLRHQPDLLVADPATHLDAVLDREPWRSLRAVRLHRIYSVDPDIIERPGPQYNEGLRWLVERLAPLATPSR